MLITFFDMLVDGAYVRLTIPRLNMVRSTLNRGCYGFIPLNSPFVPAKTTGYFFAMPNRILRDWTASEAINSLSPYAETLFTRLIMKADDYGRYYANAQLLNGTLFPLKRYTAGQVLDWLKELCDAGVIQLYTDQGKIYLEIKNFNQRLRVMKSKFATPNPANLTVLSSAVKCPPETKRNEVETKRSRNESETETNSTSVGVTDIWPSFLDFWETYGKKTNRNKCELVWKKIKQGAREKIMQHLQQYVPATPDVQYRKNPLTYLTNESWNDEIIFSNGKSTKQNNITAEGTLKRLNSYPDK